MKPRVVLAVVPFLLNACSALPTERQLVATWTAPKSSTEINGVEQSHSKQMIDFTFAPDHSFAWGLHGKRPTAAGRWRLHGRSLITEHTTPGKGHKLAYPYRDKIIKLTSQELVYLQGE